jgi:hypothetical protein
MRVNDLVVMAAEGATIYDASSVRASSLDQGAFQPSSLSVLLALHPDPSRLRAAAIAWGIDDFDVRQRGEERLHGQIARMVQSGRLGLRSIPLFRDDPRGPIETSKLRLYQLGGGPPPAPQAAAPRPSVSAPPPPRTQVRSPAPPPPKDFEDEDAQIAVLRAAAKDGTPFCEQCARAALRAAKA